MVLGHVGRERSNLPFSNRDLSFSGGKRAFILVPRSQTALTWLTSRAFNLLGMTSIATGWNMVRTNMRDASVQNLEHTLQEASWAVW